MKKPYPVTLEAHGIRLEPLDYHHHDELLAAAADGKLWELWFTAVPEPSQTSDYIMSALAGQEAGHMLPWAVRELEEGNVIGSSRHYEIVTSVDPVEIGFTLYAKNPQRSHLKTHCQVLLLEHPFQPRWCHG